ncbi:MAG TPA: CoA ester lyase [Candidatus Nanopelagicaceae bacterium]
MIARSHLYIPGDDSERLARAVTRGADALIVDLEDGVAADRKSDARAVLSDWLNNVETKAQIWVRLNSGEMREKDLYSAVHMKVSGLIQAKSENPHDLVRLDHLLTTLELQRDIPIRQIKVVPLIESALGVLRAQEIASSPRVARLQVGEADLKTNIGVTLGGDECELLYVRSLMVLVCAAIQIDPPVAPVSTNFRDLDAFRHSTLGFKRLGYFGRSCIHPAQVEISNQVFTPSAEELHNAADVMERFETAEGGVCLDSRGQMIDMAVARSAQRILDLHATFMA